MSLNWSIQNVRDWNDLMVEGEDGEQELGVKTQGLLWATMAVDLPGITEENAQEFYARLRVWEALVGSLVVIDGEPYRYTPEEVHRHIGLSTNVARKTVAQWRKNLVDVALRDAERRYEVAIRESSPA